MVEIAKLIPMEEREKILSMNVIPKAVGISSDPNMHHLAVVWQTYVEPTIKLTCNPCYERILKNYQNLHKTFIQLSQEEKLLNGI